MSRRDAEQNGHQQTVLPDRFSKILQRLGIEKLAGLVRVGLEMRKLQLVELPFFIRCGWVCHDVTPLQNKC